MLELIPKTNFGFIGKRYLFFAISGSLLGAGLVSLILKGGPKWGLDFTGGALVEVKFQTPPTLEEVRKSLSNQDIPPFELQSVPGEGVFIIRTKLPEAPAAASAVSTGAFIPGAAAASADEVKTDIQTRIQKALQTAFPNQTLTFMRAEYVGPTVGRHLGRQTLIAFLLTFAGIIVYVAFRFHSGIWGAAGVIALIHDVFATVGLFSLLNKEISVTIVAALLTIAGYSINDTIVIFDYMREKLRFLRTEPLQVIIDRSLNETLSRTIITNATVFAVVLALYFLGGEVIHDFAVAMIFGAIVGTYSSIAIAAPLIFEWEKIQAARKPKLK